MRRITQLFRKPKYWGWILILVLFTNFVNAHEIHLKSGRIIKTQSVQEKGNMVIYQAKGGGTVKISKELVREVIYTKPTPVSASPKESGGLVAHYPFNGDANDTINPRNNGVVHGARLVADRFGTTIVLIVLMGLMIISRFLILCCLNHHFPYLFGSMYMTLNQIVNT